MLLPEDMVKPRHYFAAAIILYMRESSTLEEEAAFQRLDSALQNRYDGAHISYEVLASGPPTAPAHYAYTAAERNWCKTKLDYLDKQIKDTEAGNRLGLPIKIRKIGGKDSAGFRQSQGVMHLVRTS